MADTINASPIWIILYWWFLLCLAVGPPLIVAGLIWTVLSRKPSPILTDILFAIATFEGFELTWVAAMGHSEANWASGYRHGWLIISCLWMLTIVQRLRTGERAKSVALVLLFGIGTALAFVLPIMMVSLRPFVIINGEKYFEENAVSIHYAFAIVLTSLLWFLDTLADAIRDFTVRDRAAGLT